MVGNKNVLVVYIVCLENEFLDVDERKIECRVVCVYSVVLLLILNEIIGSETGF
jgi:hypothetical protein